MPNPETAKALIRNVVDSCAELMIQFEFSSKTINVGWVKDWKTNGKLGNSEADREILSGNVPRKRGGRMKLLRLLHDEDTDGEAKARRSTFLLLDTLSAAERFGQHATEIGEPVPKSFISVVANAAVELLNQLKEDSGPKPVTA
jgi:hypothetical protein